MKKLMTALVALVVVCPALTRAAEVDTGPVVAGNTRFALDLYSKLKSEEGNVFFSPYSISTALAMTYGGARGKTEAEMAKTLHFPTEQEKLHRAMAALIGQINGNPKEKVDYELATANALWTQKGYKFLDVYLRQSQRYYRSGVRDVDFAGATEAARLTINKWVEDQTKDKIKELFPKGVLNSDTRLVLTNAIYFKGKWANQFKKNNTRKAPFRISKTDTVPVPMMNQQESLGYWQDKDLQVLEMPYVGKHLSMVVLLPKKVDGIETLEKNLTHENLTKWLARIRKNDVRVSMPKFKVTHKIMLTKTLKEMGMTTAFDRSADFSGLDGKPNYLYIQDVVHKAFVEVNEEGTEAAAATGVAVGAESAPLVFEFRADHPFVYLIRDKRNGSILFLGRMSNPAK